MFRAIVSGQRRGVAAGLARGCLRVAEIPYTWAVRLRNHRYDSGRTAVHQVAIPVVSVGNLTLGGTGKTPLVAWVAGWFHEHQVPVAVISRGYGAQQGKPNDEALELTQRLPDVRQLQDPDRAAAARRAAEQLHCRAVVLDDGFQHRRLARDLDIVLLDALEPFGHDHVFPRGTLREPLAGLARADIVALSRADAVDAGQRAAIRHRVERFAPQAAWLEIAHRPIMLLGDSGLLSDSERLGDSQPPEESEIQQELSLLTGAKVAAFCGIGNPDGFRHTLAQTGCDVVAWKTFPDHHAYSPVDIDELGRWAAAASAEHIVCTQKDLVKLSGERLAGIPLWAVVIETEITEGSSYLIERLEGLVEK